MPNPWQTCKLLFDENNGYFIERMKDRSYSGSDFREFLIKGDNQACSKKNCDDQDFKVEYNGWVIKCKLRRCNIVMGTLYNSK